MASTIFKPLPHASIAPGSSQSNPNGLNSTSGNVPLGLSAATPIAAMAPSLLGYNNSTAAAYNWLQFAAATARPGTGIFGIPPYNWPLFAETAASASAATPFPIASHRFGGSTVSGGGLLQACAPNLSSPEQA